MEKKIMTYMDGSKRSKGILLFNLQDSKLYKGKSAYCSALVKPKKGKKQSLMLPNMFIPILKQNIIGVSGQMFLIAQKMVMLAD